MEKFIIKHLVDYGHWEGKETQFDSGILHTDTMVLITVTKEVISILICRRRHSSIIEVLSFRGADCDTDHYIWWWQKLGKVWQ